MQRHPAEIGQTRARSLVEASTNVVVGYVVAILTQVALFPRFGIRLSTSENLIVGAVFTLVSLVRSYVLRRVFERLRVRGLQQEFFVVRRAAATVGL